MIQMCSNTGKLSAISGRINQQQIVDSCAISTDCLVLALHHQNPTHMKNKIIFSSSVLVVLCCVYFERLTSAASEAMDSPSSIQNAQDIIPVAMVEEIGPAPVKSVNLKTRRTEVKHNNDKAGTIECKGGTKLFFPSGSFVHASGKPVIGNVKLVIEECLDLDEMLAAKLSTTSGGRRLETAGMIKVQAYAGREEVGLKDGGRYNIYFPIDGERKGDFELFYGQRASNGTIDWVLDGSADPIEETASVSDPIVNDCFVQISASQYRCGTHIQEMDYFNWPLINGQNLNQWFVSNFNPDPEMLDDFCANRMYSQITFHVNEDGSFRDYYVSHTSKVEYDRLLATALSSMPRLDLKKFMPVYTTDHACILSFGRQQERSTKQFVDRFVKRYDYDDPDKNMSDVSTEDLNYYVFSSTELGWINCDRFLQNDLPLVDVTVRAPMCENAAVSMVFDSDKCILSGVKQGDEYVFKGVPANRMVRVITLDNPAGNPHMEVSKMNTSSRSYVVRSMEPITLSDLDRALCWN